MIERIKAHCPPLYSGWAVQRAYQLGLADAGRGMLGLLETLVDDVEIISVSVGDSGIEFRENPDPEVPIYTSYDGQEKIYDPMELARSLGDSADEAVMSIGIILGHGEKRDLTVDEVEKLRKGQILLQHIPDSLREQICADGKEMIDQMNLEISKFEAHLK